MNELSTTTLAALDEGFELSPQQARAWSQLERAYGSPRAFIDIAMPSSGNDDLDRLRAALIQVIDRHEVLRTRLQTVKGLALPVQVIAPNAVLHWQTNTQSAEGLSVTLTTGFTGTTVRLEVAALLCDAASLLCLVEQWATVYQGKILASDVLQYADYAAWRCELAAGNQTELAFWKARLAMEDDLRLPLRPQTRVATRGDLEHLDFRLDKEHAASLNSLSLKLGCPSAIPLLATWITLLYRHSNANLVGLGLDWQTRDDYLGEAIGLFSESLPLSATIPEGTNFLALCRQLTAEVTQLQDRRSSFPSPVDSKHRAGFRYIPAITQQNQNDLAWKIQDLGSPTSALLQLTVRQEGDDYCLHLDYHSSVYKAATIDLLRCHFQSLLEAALSNPDHDLRQLPMITEGEATQLRAWSHGHSLTAEQQTQYQVTADLPNLTHILMAAFNQQTHLPAVVDNESTLTYEDLHQQSTWLALQLLDRGFKPGDTVAHCLPRNRQAVIGLVAIVKAGGVYLPIDPHYPKSRIAHLLQDSDARYLLTTQHLGSQLSPELREKLNLIPMDALSASDAHKSLPGLLQPSAHTAYIIYTSGSTGVPKGVPISHSAALHSLAARLAYYPHRVETFLLLSSFAFDSSIAGLLWTLAQGGCLQIANESQQKDAHALAQLLHEQPISHLLALPSLYQLILQNLEGPHSGIEGKLPNLKAAIVAGESCPAHLVKTHHRLLPDVDLYNEYGPTEASVWATVEHCQDTETDTISIGRAIPGTRIFVLDAQLQPVATGLTGEICVAGPGLSLGYLNQPELSKEKFTRMAAFDGERIYRTGDYGYFDENGSLYFAGRQDAQIKIRGHRVEPGEIEFALQSLLSEGQAVVLATETSGGYGLRAFVASSLPLDSDELLKALARQLPAYMVPADLLVLPRFPLTANGKIDKAALLALEMKKMRPLYRAPTQAHEQLLAAIWTNMLQVSNIGLDDNFFALGGQSLLVVKLVYQMGQTFGVTLPVATVFRHPTLAQLAAQLKVSTDNSLVPLRIGDGKTHFVCFDPNDALHHYLPLTNSLPSGLSVWGLALTAEVTPEHLSLQDIASNHARILLEQFPNGDLWLCGWSMGGLLALETARELEARGRALCGVLLLDSTFRANNEALAFDQLLASVKNELDSESKSRLEVLPASVLENLGLRVQGMGKAQQLEHSLLTWCPEQRLTTLAPKEVIYQELQTMIKSRKWVEGHQPKAPATPVYAFWAEQTLQADPDLSREWEKLPGMKMTHCICSGDHDSLLVSPELQQGLLTLLPVTQAV